MAFGITALSVERYFMTKVPQTTVVGIFEDRHLADAAITELRRAGFDDSQIGVAARDTGQADASVAAEHSKWEDGAGAGALTGASVGGLVGLGIVAGVIPAIGPVIAGGALAVILANAAAGTIIATVAGTLVGLGIPEDEASSCESAFQAGGTLVTVQADARYPQAAAILQRHGAHDTQQVAR
jgi:hypothetical protein